MAKLVSMAGLAKETGYSLTHIWNLIHRDKTLTPPDVVVGKRTFYSPLLLKKVRAQLPPNPGRGRPKKKEVKE